MRIKISDKDVKHVLDLTSEELVNLLRYRNVKAQLDQFKVVSPVLIVCGDSKHQAKILEIRDVEADRSNLYSTGRGDPWDEEPEPRPPKRKDAKDIIESIPSFVLNLELSAKLFESLLSTKEVIVLIRIQNIPAYAQTSMVKVNYNLAEKDAKPVLVVKVESVKPIVELLRAQVSEPAFYEVFIIGKSEDFYDSKGNDLDDLVSLIGIRRKVDETDIALRRRVTDYLKIRMEQLSKVKDEELQGIVKEQEEKDALERKMDEADRKRKEPQDNDEQK